ncbi:MAG: peptidylprolyl isomerase [Myxococcota bacterium]|nr:peptidylprolyl isomerase [Myxococcota bacterium]
MAKNRPPPPSAVKKIDAHIAAHPVNKSDAAWKTRVPRPPTVEYSPDLDYYWFLHTSEGGIKIKLKPEYAPGHVTSTIYLTRLGFYDGLSFHRIIPKFMVQGGDPLGNGSGGPGYRMGGEFSRKARHNKRGVVSAANAGPRTDGSQFFILFGSDAEQLDGKHTVFGQVVEGMGTLKTLEMFGSESGVPQRTAYIRRAEILEQPSTE